MKFVAYTFLLLTIAFGAYSQPGSKGHLHEEREKILQMKVSYVKENLGLSETEAARFFPVYEENLRKEESLRLKQRVMHRKVKKDYQSMSDADIEKLLVDEIAVEQELVNLKKVQFEAFKKLIPIKKVVELKVVERAFNRMLMEKLRDKKGDLQQQDDKQ